MGPKFKVGDKVVVSKSFPYTKDIWYLRFIEYNKNNPIKYFTIESITHNGSFKLDKWYNIWWHEDWLEHYNKRLINTRSNI